MDKERYVEGSKNLDRSENNFLGPWKYVRISSMMSTVIKSFDIPATSVLHNYFNGLIKLFLYLYLTKFLNLQQNSSSHVVMITRILIDQNFLIHSFSARNFSQYINLKITTLDHQNNYVGN